MVNSSFKPCTSQPGNQYTGTLEAVLSELASNLVQEDISVPALVLRVMHPPRIIHALVDYKIDHPDALDIEALMQEGIAVALDVYRGTFDAAERVTQLHATIAASVYAPVLTAPLTQLDDYMTQSASAPSCSLQTAQKLAASAASDILFIALGHGGVAAGMDVYLRYCQMTGSTNSQFYVARFSTQKKKDTVPRLNPTEITYLQEIAQGKRVVIFDEDSCSGHTIKAAQRYFRSLFPKQYVEAVANLDLPATLAAIDFTTKINYALHGKCDSLFIKDKQTPRLYDTYILGMLPKQTKAEKKY